MINNFVLDDDISMLVDRAVEAHKSAFEKWQEGDVLEYWIDENGYLCIRYESGEWWHYKDLDLPFPTWW